MPAIAVSPKTLFAALQSAVCVIGGCLSESVCLSLPAANTDEHHAESAFYGEAPYRVADSFAGADGYLRLRYPTEWLVAPTIGVGFDAVSQIDRPTKIDRKVAFGFASFGLDLRYGDGRLLVERRFWSAPRLCEARVTAVYSALIFIEDHRLLIEPYVEAVAWRRGSAGDQHDELADGFVRTGYRLARDDGTGLYADGLVEPFASVSAAKKPFDNRAELRAGPRVGWGTPVGDHGWTGVSLIAQEVAGHFLRGAPPPSTPGRYASSGYVTQRYLIVVGGSW